MAHDLAQRVADDALEDTFTLQRLRAKQPRLPSGGFDWDWRGPKNDPEWAWFFNRLNWLPALWKVGKRSNDPRYHHRLHETLADWLAANPAPGRFTISAAWRPLEAARRLTNVFLPHLPQWLACPRFPETLKISLLQSLPEHARHLRKHHAPGGNHLITEMLALFQVTFVITEQGCGDTADFAAYALEKLDQEFRKQVYPDGTHKELSAHYHRIITQNFTRLHQLLATRNAPEANLWEERLAGLWNYILAVVKPSGKSPLNNDGDEEDFAKLLQRQLPPLRLPPTGTNHWFPYAGQAIMRGRNKPHWFFFDLGPRGSDHEHDDLLHCCLSIGSADFLVDNGRYTYAPGPWRDYFRGHASHNTVLINDTTAEQGPRTVPRPKTGCGFTESTDKVVAWGTAHFDPQSPAGPAEWKRTVIYKTDREWQIIDELIRFGRYTATTRWHWHPRCQITGDLHTGFLITHGDAGLKLKLLTSCPHHSFEIVQGRESPTPQGWHSERFNHKTPAPCLIIKQRASGPLQNRWQLQ